MTENNEKTVINRGTGAGGANTNATGLDFEKLTNIGEIENSIRLQKANLHKYMLKTDSIQDDEYKSSKNLAHGCKQPDDAYLFQDKKKLFIIEKKYQGGSGSVSEKLQTAVFKKQFYQKVYRTFNIYYIYMLSNYFKTSCPRELEFLEENNIPYYFQDDNIVTNVRNFIINEVNNS